jgi:hypothetical protein
MKVLGFRADPQAARIALVEAHAGQLILLNAASENKLTFPAQCSDEASQLKWLYREIERVFHEHPDISRVVIKSNEFMGTANKAKRFSSYEEAVLVLWCGLKGIPVSIKTYNSLSTRSADVKAHAAARVGTTVKYWDTKMADAVVAAWWGANNP